MTDEQPTPEPETENPNAEAARYRHRAKEAEAQRDELVAQVDALRRAAVEQQVAEHGITAPAGFWASGVTVADLLDDDGALDPEKIQKAAEDATEALGLARPVKMPYSPHEGRVTDPRGGGGWQGAFAPK